jgi:small-conductance mechanosensitive channel
MLARLSSAFDMPFIVTMLRLGLTVLLTILALYSLRLASRYTVRRLGKAAMEPERLERLETLVNTGYGAGYGLILVIAGLIALYSLGINIAPLLAGAGVVGLAVSLGAQTLIKDFIGGILILAEGQFNVGDSIKVNGVSGGVERITLRATWLRDIDGALHVVPNGEVRIVSNYTSEWARALVDLNVDYEADMGRVIRALETAAQKAQADESIAADLIEPPQALGWLGFKDWAVQVRLMAKTKAGKQWGVAMALRQYAIEALRAEGVQVALPVQEIQMREGKQV